MLRKLILQGFRSCVGSTTLELGALTLVAGANNAGKSSFLGALLVLFQSEQAASGHRLLLNGEWVDLGPYAELLSPDHEGFSIGIEGTVQGEDHAVVWDFVEGNDRGRADARVHKIEATLGGMTLQLDVAKDGAVTSDDAAHLRLLHPAAILRSTDTVALLPFRADKTLSVGPYRAPPALLSPYRSSTVGSLVGRYGEYAAEVFSERRDETTDVLPPGAAGSTESVGRAMDAWWSYILRDEIALTVSEERRFGFSVRLDTSGITDRSFGQVGFGLSQLWPILVACLVSRPGDLVIVETPEAHLHPGAQHRVARLFVELAKRGRQVIVETHSEHMVAAACLAAKEKQIAPADLALSFFSQVRGETQIDRIDVDASGRRVAAPEGFFDQSAQELLALLKPS